MDVLATEQKFGELKDKSEKTIQNEIQKKEWLLAK